MEESGTVSDYKHIVTENLRTMMKELQYGHSVVYALPMPSESCAQTAREILSGDPGFV